MTVTNTTRSVLVSRSHLRDSVAEEVATLLTSGVAVVSGLGVGIVCDHESVAVLGLAGVVRHRGGSVVHTFADLGHGVLLQESGVLLLLVNCVKSFLG